MEITDIFVIELGRSLMLEALTISLPILGVGLLIGLSISVFQAATQLNEQTLTIVPKLLLVGSTIIVLMPWLLGRILTVTLKMFEMIPDVAKNF